MTGIPSRIRRLPSKRKKKIALKRYLKAALSGFVGRENTPETRAEMVIVTMRLLGLPAPSYRVWPEPVDAPTVMPETRRNDES